MRNAAFTNCAHHAACASRCSAPSLLGIQLTQKFIATEMLRSIEESDQKLSRAPLEKSGGAIQSARRAAVLKVDLPVLPSRRTQIVCGEGPISSATRKNMANNRHRVRVYMSRSRAPRSPSNFHSSQIRSRARQQLNAAFALPEPFYQAAPEPLLRSDSTLPMVVSIVVSSKSFVAQDLPWVFVPLQER